MATMLERPSAEAVMYNEEIVPELIGRARELKPLLERHATYSDTQRMLHKDVIQAIKDAELFDMALPRRWGGLGTSATAMALVGAELARADPSVGWVYTVYHGTTWVASLACDEVQEAVFGAMDKPVLCGIANPPGTLTPVDGGYILNGRWHYASGCDHADWAQLGSVIKGPDGEVKAFGNAYVRMSQVTIDDTWFMMAMKGTGSKTIVAENVFIPATQFHDISKLGMGIHQPGKRHVGEPSDYWPFMPFLRATAHAVVAGALSEVLERVAANSGKRPIVYTHYTKQSECVTAQAEFGKAAGMISCAEAVTVKNCQAIDQIGLTLGKEQMSFLERAKTRGEAAVVVDLASRALDSLMFLAGSSSFADSNPLSRLYRDTLFAMRHVTNLPYVGYEVYGKAVLGIEEHIAPPDFV